MTRNTYIRLMDGTCCLLNELPDYSDKEVLIPVFQEQEIIERTEIVTTSIIGVYDCYIIYNDYIFFNDGLDEYGENQLTLYNYTCSTSIHCSGNSLIWKRDNRPVIIDFENNEIVSLDGKEHYSFEFKIPISRSYPLIHWDFNGIIDCKASEEDLAIQIRDAWERPESHTLIIHSMIPDDYSSHIGSFEITLDEDEILMGRILCVKNSKVYIKRLCNEKTKLCVYDLYGNMICEITEPSMRDEWIKVQNDISYKAIIRLGLSMFVEHENVKRYFRPIVYNMEGIPDERFLQIRLRSDGLLSDNKPYYVQWYWNTCSNDKNVSRMLSSISSADKLANIEDSQYFESLKFKTIVKAIYRFQNNIHPKQEVMVWFPSDLSNNDIMNVKEMRKALDSYGINYNTENHCIVPETESKKIVFIIDFETDKQRQMYFVNEVIHSCLDNEPSVVMISLNKIIDEHDLAYLIAAYNLKMKLNLSSRKSTVKLSCDEETLIMNSLAGHGPDPEVFGF